MLVLGSTWYQFDGTVGHLSSLNYLVVSLYTLHLLTLACHFAHLMYQPFGLVSWISSCITVEFLCVLFLHFISQTCITVYTSFLHMFGLLLHYPIYMFVFLLF